MKRLLLALAALILLSLGLAACSSGPSQPYVIPSQVPANCSADVTSYLNQFLAKLPAGAVVDLPNNACYEVSDTSTVLTLDNLSNITINGNGTTFRQTKYVCGSNTVQPVVTFTRNTNISVNNVTVLGPGGSGVCGGGSSEGDYGILLGQSTPGNAGLTFDNVNVKNTDGDGLAAYPQLNAGTGINTDITVENSTYSNIGYHTFTPEGVNGLTIRGNTFVNDGNFMDLEVDGIALGPGNTTTPTGIGQWNLTVDGNTFTAASAMSVTSLQSPCIPQKNLIFSNNTLDPTSKGITFQLGGSASNQCAQDTGLTISGNKSAGIAHSPCGGSIATPPACSMIEINDYSGVTIAANTFTAYDGDPGYFPNTIFVPCITLTGVANALIKGNTCNNSWDVWDATQAQFPSTNFPNSAISACGNTYWLTQPINGAQADPKFDGTCTTSFKLHKFHK